MVYMQKEFIKVTILILIDGFLQYLFEIIVFKQRVSHNPYFNRWFSAIHRRETIPQP